MPTTTHQTYYQRWSSGEGGKKRNERRRQRYKEDPAYRDAVQAQKREARRKVLMASLKEHEEAVAAQKDPTAPPEWHSITYRNPETGTTQVLFSLGAVEAATRASPQALRLWERDGKIPGATYRDVRGTRYYAIERIEEIVTAMAREGLEARAARSEVREGCRIRRADGAEVVETLYPVTQLADALGRASVTLVTMEAHGVLPATPFRLTSRGRRYYTEDQIQAAREVLAELSQELALQPGVVLRGKAAQTEFHTRLTARWALWESAEVIDDGRNDGGGDGGETSPEQGGEHDHE